MAGDTKKLIFAADLAGTFVFGVEGALTAIFADLDALGIMVLAFATALGGGIIRDVLIGATPPNAIRDWRYAATAFSAGLVTFVAHPLIGAMPGYLFIVLDAAGLALFAVAGTQKALSYGISAPIAVLMGTITGVGGGTIRDLLLAQIPAVLRFDIYATAALAGSALMVAGRRAGLPPRATALLGGLSCFTIRLVAVWQHWHLPHA